MEANRYETPTSFRQALENRLNRMAHDQAVDVQRLRRKVAFDRLLSRLFQDPGSPWILKGGYAMELRTAAARTTRDIDLTLTQIIDAPSPESLNDSIRQQLQAAATSETPDHFSFLIGAPVMDLEAAPYGGARFPVEARLAGRIFARFHLDVAAGDVFVEPAIEAEGSDWLQFAGIPRCRVRMISGEQQFAEKIHAYTIPREGKVNSRVRDLIDLYLLVKMGLDTERVGQSLAKTFARRNTHTLPAKMDPPPANWRTPFGELAKECGISPRIEIAFQAVSEFYDSIKR